MIVTLGLSEFYLQLVSRDDLAGGIQGEVEEREKGSLGCRAVQARDPREGATTERWSVTGPSWRGEDRRGLCGHVAHEHFEQRDDMI